MSLRNIQSPNTQALQNDIKALRNKQYPLLADSPTLEEVSGM
jgi:hypothetical protein